MKIAVINFSGNVGKSTIAKHLLQPRLPASEVVEIESINADTGQSQALRGRQFGELQEYLQIADNVVVDIGASNVEELLASMRRFHGSHQDFDYFVVPTVPALKQQQDTIATLVELGQMGVAASKVRIVFNMVDPADDFPRAFDPVLAFVAEHRAAKLDPACRLGINEVYSRIRASGESLASLANDPSDYKAMIATAANQAEKIALARRLATRRLATGVLSELDACYEALSLGRETEPPSGSHRKVA